MPDLVVAVVGTGTEVGKTWLTASVASALRERGVVVAARKPVQSFAPDDPAGERDAAVLAAATGERADDVCPPGRSYEVPMAPPMAAEVLGRPAFTLADLLGEVEWPAAVRVGFVETVGGARSPVTVDADSADLARAVDPDLIVLVADAGLGTLNLVRLSMTALDETRTLVVLNRFDESDELHRRNRQWLVQVDGLDVEVSPAAVAARIAALSTR